MNERKVATGAVILLLTVAIVASRNLDAIYVVASLVFFAICIAYAQWCERL